MRTMRNWLGQLHQCWREWRLRCHVEQSRSRLRLGRGDIFDTLLVSAYDDPEPLIKAMRALNAVLPSMEDIARVLGQAGREMKPDDEY